MRSVEISITQEDIDDATRELVLNHWGNRCKICPVARAIARVFPDSEPIVNGEVIHFPNWENDYHNTIALPLDARLFIQKFDAGNYVEPFTFNLNLVENILP